MRWQIWLILLIFAWAVCGTWATDTSAFLPRSPKYGVYMALTIVPFVAGMLLMLDDLRRMRRRR
ncbi:MAG TPA: hypothetical protein VM328_13605 [Fimbriimonadaceae bacterium]|jgi:hypothetical protein|nr:hypothetical protein [Fimbriimonadaceae bacterium]